MIEYIYIVKCPDREDEMFNFFTDARMQCDLLMSKKPSITQVEVERNDFGECTNSHDLGTVWSWEEAMKDTEAEPAAAIFTKDDLKDYIPSEDTEFGSIDNSVDFEIEEVSEKKPIEEDLISSYDYTHMTKEELYDRLVNKFEDVEVDVGDLGITDVPFYDGGRYSNSTLVAMFEDDVFYVTMWHYSDDGEETESGSYDFETDSFEELWDELMFYKPEALIECSERKPIPEGMTIEQLQEEMEDNEDTVECSKCGNLVEKANCHHNKEGFGWCCNTCEPADTLVEAQEEYELAAIVKDSINHLTNDIGKDPWAKDFADDVIADIENNYDVEVPEDLAKYNSWANSIASEVSRQLNNPLDEEAEPKEIHDLGNEYDGGYPAETSAVSDSHLRLCPECGKETFDIETGICVDCGFN